MKTGIGTYAAELETVCRLVPSYALTRLAISTTRLASRLRVCSTRRKPAFAVQAVDVRRVRRSAPPLHANTTIGAVVTNAEFSKAEMNKIAAMAHNGYARAIAPVNTTADGDSLYAMSVGEIQADINIIGTLAADVVQKAIYNAVWETGSAYGLPCAKDICLK